MEETFSHRIVEPRIISMWENGKYFSPKVDHAKKPFSMFLVPPNASGGLHVGNALMIAIQDILARFHRALGEPTLWIPGTDHGGYETQVTFERELESRGKDRFMFKNKDLVDAIERFVADNNEAIIKEIRSLGASVDWPRFRYTLDEEAKRAVVEAFKKMVTDGLIYRRPYIVNYCPSCATVLSDIELKETPCKQPLYHLAFRFKDDDDKLTLASTRPEFIFATTHVLVHPADDRFARHIGRVLLNPATGRTVEIIASKRNFDKDNPEPYLAPFSPSYDKYDYQYALYNDLPAYNLLDWNGRMAYRYPGIWPAEARERELKLMQESGLVEHIDHGHAGSAAYCKRGHEVGTVIMQTWFLKMDEERMPLRKNALDAIENQGLTVIPEWRMKNLVEWMKKMPDWPIARQNAWGIRIPIWYEVSDPGKFTVWFADREGKKFYGSLQTFLDNGVGLEEVADGLERIYAEADVQWTLAPEPGKTYLPETDTFDTWFSSGQWGSIVFGRPDGEYFPYFYPSDSIVIGHDLVRLSVSRKILLSQYLSGRLPFKTVYVHRLITSTDGRKMSKSLGNTVPLEYYLEKYGADATRLALVSNSMAKEDFPVTDGLLEKYHGFIARLWRLGLSVQSNKSDMLALFDRQELSRDDLGLLDEIEKAAYSVGRYLGKYSFAYAQERIYDTLALMENFQSNIGIAGDNNVSISILGFSFKKYLVLLHPFAPFVTEELYANIYNPAFPLAASPWPDKMNYFGE